MVSPNRLAEQRGARLRRLALAAATSPHYGEVFAAGKA